MSMHAAVGVSGNARYAFGLRASSTARALLVAEWARVCWLWNECVARSKKADAEGELCGPAALDRMLTQARAVTPWLAAGSSVPQQQVIRDFGKSRSKALKDIKDGHSMRRRAGMPRYRKKRDSRPSLDCTRRGFRLKDGRLHLAGGIVLTVVWSRDLPCDPSSVRVCQDTLGHWYASFVAAAHVQPRPEAGRVLGVDWGVKETATTTSDDHDLPHPEFGRQAAQRLAHYQRMMARRRPARGQAASRGCRAAQQQAAKLHKKVTRQRQDTARKWAKRVVTDHDALAVEDFKPKFLGQSTMARKAADAAIGATKQALLEMGWKHGRAIHLVHPAYSTMDCAKCGARTKHQLPLSERTYTCTTWGNVSPRDKNSTRVMLIRAGLYPAGTEGRRPPGTPLREAA
ncbi:transposase [Streptomyces sp. NPDC051014]|uniref:RNA-guided endonuclease InsQ/TnpB family protein n=1 Tax=Streptomyces sp. NPDC051014 TaxID=3155751 RepID=UPI0033E6C7FE